jgi:glycosyltransferase involved in cell wall biosynthesis
MSPGISIAMCTFNGERFLNAQLESIAAQSRLPDELAVCDDGSSDGTRELIEGFAFHAPFPVKLVVNERNLGSTQNFEQAISLCRYDLVALADQDDVWYQHKLKRIENVFSSDKIALAFSDADIIDGDSQPINYRLWNRVSFDSVKQRQFADGQALQVLLRHPIVTGATMAFRRKFFHFIQPIPANDIHDRWISFLLACVGRIAVIPEPLMQYREHDEQQEGLVPRSPQKRMAHAKSRGTQVYLEEIIRLQQLSARIAEHNFEFPGANEMQDQIRKKIRHLEHRTQLPSVRFARLPGIFHETINANYWRFSGGAISVAKDLLIR